MRRENLKKIIKARSFWRIDKRKGNYKLPNGERLYYYVRDLVYTQLELDNLGIRENGDICSMTSDYVLRPFFQEHEQTSQEEQEERIHKLINEML